MPSQRPRATRVAPSTGDLFAPRPTLDPVVVGGGLARGVEPASAEPASAEPAPVDGVAPLEPDAPDAPDALDVPDDPPALRPAPVRLAPTFDGPRRDFEYNAGVHLVESILWCDADRRHDMCFVSHAHVDAVGKNRHILATDKTERLLSRGAGKAAKSGSLPAPFRRPLTLGPLELELHPAGHVLGSAQLLIVRDGRRVVYTSDVNTRATATCERAKAVPCDALVIPATYGEPTYRFPPREEVLDALQRFIERCLEDRATPVLIANQVGTAQELMRVLGERGHRLRVHRSIYDIAKIYRDLGVSLPGSRRFAGTPARDEVVIFPPILRRHASIRKLKKARTAMISGRAVEPGFAFRHKVDQAFALSDTVDHHDLLAFIAETGARDVYLSSGYIEELGAELRARGLRVYSLQKPEQLALF